MASELSKFIDDELQKVDTAEERERLISKLRVRVCFGKAAAGSLSGSRLVEHALSFTRADPCNLQTTARDAPSLSRAGPSWQEQLLPRKRLLIIGLCVFLLVAVAAVAVSKGSSSGKGKRLVKPQRSR